MGHEPPEEVVLDPTGAWHLSRACYLKGARVASYEYGTWGELLSSTGTFAMPRLRR